MSKKTELMEIVAALEPLESGPRRRIPGALQERIAEYARERMASGLSRAAVAREVGISGPTLARALGLERGGKRVPAGEVALTPVRVVAPPGDEPAIRVRTASGLVVEGLSIEALASLIRELA